MAGFSCLLFHAPKNNALDKFIAKFLREVLLQSASLSLLISVNHTLQSLTNQIMVSLLALMITNL